MPTTQSATAATETQTSTPTIEEQFKEIYDEISRMSQNAKTVSLRVRDLQRAFKQECKPKKVKKHTEPRDRDTKAQKSLRHIIGNKCQQEDSIDKRCNPVNRQPGRFPARVSRAHDFFSSEEKAFAKKLQLPRGPLIQVWQIKQVTEDIISIKAQQRIGVEEDRRNRSDEHHIISEAIHEWVRRRQPDIQSDRRDQEFRTHPCGINRDPLPTATETPA